MSGHNKWSKIKHKKAATDADRSKLFSKHAKLIAMESRLSGGDRNAAGLLAAIERAKKDSMPKDNIERAIERGGGTEGAALKEVIFEGYGPEGVALLIKAVTDNNNRTSQEIKNIFSKSGAQLGAPGSAAWAFEKTDSGYKPLSPIEVSDEAAEKLAALVEALSENDDVQEIYTTADTTE